MNSKPRLSVILPVRNEARSLAALLASIAQQKFPARDLELIVADGRSTDNSRDIIGRFASSVPFSVRLVDNPGIRSGPGRNAGLRAASGEFILFIDGHCRIPSNRLFSDTVFLFETTGAECLCRPQPLLAPAPTEFGAAVALVRASALGHGRDSLIYDMTASGFVDPASSGAAYRHSVFAEIGFYDERFDACEDVELNTRLHKKGMKAYTDPRLAVFYEPRATFRALIRQMARYGRGRVRLMLMHHDSISASQIAPALLVAWIATAIICAITREPSSELLRLILFVPVCIYLAAVALSSLGLARRSGIGLLWRAPIIYGAVHLGLGAGIWAEALHRAACALTGRRPLPAGNSAPGLPGY